MVTNGAKLRLLRDSARLSKPTYLEFDIQAMMEGNAYGDFAALYRLLHATRLPQSGMAPHDVCSKATITRESKKAAEYERNYGTASRVPWKYWGQPWSNTPEMNRYGLPSVPDWTKSHTTGSC